MGYFVVALIIVLLIATVLQAVLTPKPKIENGRPKGLGDFDFPTATEDRAIPIMWGTVDIKGPNVLWYGDLKTTRTRKTKGGQKIFIAYQYWVGMDLLLCYGPIDRVTRLEIGDKFEYPPTNIFGLTVVPAFPFQPTEAGLAVEFSDFKVLGGLGKGGTAKGDMTFYNGGPNQLQSPYMQAQLGNDIPAYVNVAHVVMEQFQIGESVQVGAYVFRVTRFPDNLALTGSNHIINGTIDDGDANPMEILFEVLTSDIWGLSIDISKIDLQSFRDAGNTLADEGNGMSWIITTVLPAVEIITEITRQVDAVFFEDADGNFCVRLVRDDYVPAALPLFDESNIVKLDEFTRSSWAGSQNHVNIGYSDRAKNFQATGAMSQDLANVRIQGAEVRADYNYPAVKTASTAQAIAERELRSLSFPLAKVVLTTNRDGATLIPGDVIRLSWSKLSIAEMVIRVAHVDLGDIVNGKVRLTGIQDVFRVAEPIFTAPQPTGWTRPSDTALPFIATEELVREMPRLFGNLYPDLISNPALARTWNIVRRPASQPSTLDAEIFVDDGGGGGFLEGFGEIQLIPIALLDAEYPAATADIEVSDLLSVDTTIDFEDLTNAAPVQIAAGFNLVLIEGSTQAEDEVIGYETLVDDGDATFKLRNVHRGLMDTQARTHAIGARCWLFAEAPSYSSSTFGDTEAITVKHVTGTTTDTLEVADALANAITFARRTQRPHHPADFTVNATRVPVAVDEAADLDFDWEHRLNADLTVRDANDGDATGQDTEVEYDIEFRNAVTQAVLRSSTLATPAPGWLTFLYTSAFLQSDTGEVGNFPLEVRLQARYAAGATNNPANLTSLQEVTKQFNVDMGGATVQSIDLDGTTEYLAKTSQTVVGLANVWSFNVWVRGTSSAGGTQRDIFHLDPFSTDANRISLVLTDDSNGSAFNIQLYGPSALFKDYDFGSYTVNTWTMLTITWDGTVLTVYQDGVAQTPTKNVDFSPLTQFDLGRRVIIGGTVTPAASWVGQIFSPAMWTTELAAAEVTAIDAGTSTFNLRENSGGYVSRDTLNHLWDFRTSASIGADYRNSTVGNTVDVDTNSANITAADLNPGQVP